MTAAASIPRARPIPAPGQLRAGAHTDYGAITILEVEEAPGGLQVRHAPLTAGEHRRAKLAKSAKLAIG